MPLRLQRRISILPGVRLNFSRSGVSATVGVRGASVTLGGRGGPTANLGIPGTGLSYRAPLSRYPSLDPERTPAPPPIPPTLPRSPAPVVLKPIQSDEVSALTTPALAALRDLLVQGQLERADADQNVEKARAYFEAAVHAQQNAQATFDKLEQTVARLEASWFRRFRTAKIAQTKVQAEQAKRKIEDAVAHVRHAMELKEIAEQRSAELYVDLDFGLPGAIHAAWTRLSETFETLSMAELIWDITASGSKRPGAQRSAATEIVDRKPTAISFSELPIIQSQYKPLKWRNVNGSDIYLYPGFLVVFQTIEQFALLDLNEVDVEFVPTHFEERQKRPSDAQQAGMTWTYTNRDGTPDRRYNANPQIPVMLYGEIHWRSKTGLAEAFMVSDAKAAAHFADALSDFRTTLSHINQH